MEEMREAFGKALVDFGREYPNLYVLDADLNTSTRTLLFKNAYPYRFLQMGIAEQNMVGVSAGLAAEGKIPIACTFAAFMSLRVLDQVSVSVAYPKLNVKLAGAYCGLFTSQCGATHQSVQDLANYRAMPNMYVADPADNHELYSMMKAAVEHVGPVYFRVTRMAPEISLTEGKVFEWGKGYTLLDGKDVTIVSTGIASQWAHIAAKKLRADGIGARHLHMPSIKPFDTALVLRAAEETNAIITVENHSVIGGLGGAVCETVCEEYPVIVKRLGIQDIYGDTAPDMDLVPAFGIDFKTIYQTAIEALKPQHRDDDRRLGRAARGHRQKMAAEKKVCP